MGRQMRRALVACVSLGAVSLVLAGASGAADPPAGCTTTAGTTTCVFAYTGSVQTWTVPAGVTSATFDVYGGAGGDVTPVGLLGGGSGGQGGHVQATVALTPGASLNLRVGGRGGDSVVSPNPFNGTLTVAGGFNGGGSTGVTCGGCGFVLGGGGGGASDVRTAGDGLADRLLVAGGGGGAGTGGISGVTGDGGDSATAGASATSSLGGPPITCSGGAAGTLVGPGAAGGGTDCTGDSAGSGAEGGDGITFDGAGGGGYFGGGTGARSVDGGIPSTGGGGGSDYPDPASPPSGISSVTVTDGARSGDGLITVAYPETASDLLSELAAAVDEFAPEVSAGEARQEDPGLRRRQQHQEGVQELQRLRLEGQRHGQGQEAQLIRGGRTESTGAGRPEQARLLRSNRG